MCLSERVSAISDCLVMIIIIIIAVIIIIIIVSELCLFVCVLRRPSMQY